MVQMPGNQPAGNKPDPNKAILNLWADVTLPSKEKFTEAAAKTALGSKYANSSDQQKAQLLSNLLSAAGKPLADRQQKQTNFQNFTEDAAIAFEAANSTTHSSIEGALGGQERAPGKKSAA